MKTRVGKSCDPVPGAWQLAAQFSELNIGRGDFERGFIDPNRWTNRLDQLMAGVNWWPNQLYPLELRLRLDRFQQSDPRQQPESHPDVEHVLDPVRDVLLSTFSPIRSPQSVEREATPSCSRRLPPRGPRDLRACTRTSPLLRSSRVLFHQPRARRMPVGSLGHVMRGIDAGARGHGRSALRGGGAVLEPRLQHEERSLDEVPRQHRRRDARGQRQRIDPEVVTDPELAPRSSLILRKIM